MPKRPPEYTPQQLEALNRKMEDAVGVHLFDGVRAMRRDMSEGEGQELLHEAIKNKNFDKLDGRIPYKNFHEHVDRAADKLGALAPATRDEVRAGIRGGFTGEGVRDDTLRRPLNFDAPLPSKTAALGEGRNAMHANLKRTVKEDRYVRQETRQRMRDYMRDLLGPQKRSITAAVQAGVERSLTPQQVAKRIISEIGLTERQQGAVDRAYQNDLKQGMTEEQADANRTAKSEALLKYRADTIAVTETRTLSETLKTSEWLSLEGDGQLGDNPTVTWILGALDDKTCPMCIAVSNTSMPLGTFFTLSDGTECLPGFAHPRCRCYSMLTTDDDNIDKPGKQDVDSRTRGKDALGGGSEDEDMDEMASRA